MALGKHWAARRGAQRPAAAAAVVLCPCRQAAEAEAAWELPTELNHCFMLPHRSEDRLSSFPASSLVPPT